MKKGDRVKCTQGIPGVIADGAEYTLSGVNSRGDKVTLAEVSSSKPFGAHRFVVLHPTSPSPSHGVTPAMTPAAPVDTTKGIMGRPLTWQDFKNVHAGECACGIVRSECEYHREG